VFGRLCLVTCWYVWWEKERDIVARFTVVRFGVGRSSGMKLR
jgi:hypothetical protein